jgi:hypothetical protein
VVFSQTLVHATGMRKLGYLVAVTLVFVGCGSDDDDGGSKGTGGSSTGGTSSGGTGGSGGSTGGSGGSTGGSGGATGGTAGTATGGAAGAAGSPNIDAGSGGKPNLDGGTGGKPNLDAGGNSCTGTADCKLFSSYCVNAPCQCIPLHVDQKNPPCQGGQVLCTIDPCLNKQAACVNGACVIAP